MKKKTKRIAIILAIVMSLWIIAIGTGCGGRFLTEGDFLLEIEVNKTEISVGDSIVVTTTLTSLTRRRLTIKNGNPRFRPTDGEKWRFEVHTEEGIIYPSFTLEARIERLDRQITEEWITGSLLPAGRHELTFEACFDIMQNSGRFFRSEVINTFLITSNTIEIIVNE